MAVLPTNYYMISNRTYSPSTGFGTTVAADGALTYLYAPVSDPVTFTVTDWPDFLAKVQSDIYASVAASQVTRLNLFVHGYGVPFDKAESVFPTYFAHLAQAGYYGIQIGFDWPSDDLASSIGSGQQKEAFQEAKAKAQTTGAESFPLLMQALSALKESPGTPAPVMSAICHSMGNYAMFEGAGAFSQQGSNPLFDHILCVAAMLENNGFNSTQSETYAADIVAAGTQVTIYYSAFDDVLPEAAGAGYDGYLPNNTELGISGPTAYDGTLLANVLGLDCSLVVDKTNAKIYEPNAKKPLTHTAYFFIPWVLEDLATTLMGGTQYPDRVPLQGGNGVGFQMIPIPS